MGLALPDSCGLGKDVVHGEVVHGEDVAEVPACVKKGRQLENRLDFHVNGDVRG
jgi:hypothetical protein